MTIKTPETLSELPASDREADLFEFRLARQADLRRTVLGRSLIHAFPIVAATVAVSYAAFMDQVAPTGAIPSVVAIVVLNAALAAVVSAAGVMFLTGRLWVRVAGAFAYAVLGLIIFATAGGCLTTLYHEWIR